MGACMLLRREAVDQVGECDEDYFLFSEETDWCFRFRKAGWEVVFFPGAECVHVRGASHSGRLYRENLRGHLLFLWKHRGPKVAERARRLLLVSLRLRGLVFRGERGRAYRDGASWLASGNAADARRALTVIFLYLKLAFATAVVLAPGWLLARALGVRSVSATLAWSLAVVFGALAVTFALGSTLTLTFVLLVIAALAALWVGVQRGWRRAETVPRAFVGVLLGRSGRTRDLDRRPGGAGRRALPPRARPEAPPTRRAVARPGLRVRGRQPASRLRVSALARVPRVDREGCARGPRARRHAPAVHPRAARGGRRVRGGVGALPAHLGGRRHGRRPGRDDLLRARDGRRLRLPRAARDRLAPAARPGRPRTGARVGALADASAASSRRRLRAWSSPSSTRPTRSFSGSRSSASSRCGCSGRAPTCAPARWRSRRSSLPPDCSCSGCGRS